MSLLRIVVRCQLTEQRTDDGAASLLSVINWNHLLWLGRQHGVLLFVHGFIKAGLADRCPPAIMDQLTGFSEMSRLRAMAHFREACQIQSLFDQNDIKAVATDRWVAAQCGYGHVALLEPSTSFHYLVADEAMERVAAVLLASGHSAESDAEKLIKPYSTPVLLNRALGEHPSANRLLTNLGHFTLGGRRFNRLTTVNWLLQRISERGGSPPVRLIHNWEIVAMARSLSAEEWNHLLAEADYFGLRDTVVKAIKVSYEALEIPVPAELLSIDGFGETRLKEPAYRSRKMPTAPFLPSPPRTVVRMLELAEATASDVVYDLGCGDGRFLVTAAKSFGARGVGVDLNPERIAEANALAAKNNVSDRISFICGDVFEADISQATVLCLYLLPVFYPRLREKLTRECKPGLRIVSHEFIFPDWPPERTEIIRVGALKCSQVYLWRLE